MMKFQGIPKKLKLSLNVLLIVISYEFFANFEITRNVTQVDKICFMNFVDLTYLAHLPWLILQPSVASTMFIYESSL
jgi:hypothetical protein